MLMPLKPEASEDAIRHFSLALQASIGRSLNGKHRPSPGHRLFVVRVSRMLTAWCTKRLNTQRI